MYKSLIFPSPNGYKRYVFVARQEYQDKLSPDIELVSGGLISFNQYRKRLIIQLKRELMQNGITDRLVQLVSLNKSALQDVPELIDCVPNLYPEDTLCYVK